MQQQRKQATSVSHGLVVRRSHDDSVFVGERCVERIVVVERIAPHRRPEVVAFEPKNELEDFLVDAVIDAAEFLSRPTGERRRFIVDENPAVFDARLALRVAAR